VASLSGMVDSQIKEQEQWKVKSYRLPMEVEAKARDCKKLGEEEVPMQKCIVPFYNKPISLRCFIRLRRYYLGKLQSLLQGVEALLQACGSDVYTQVYGSQEAYKSNKTHWRYASSRSYFSTRIHEAKSE
jgi:hypothetical protein